MKLCVFGGTGATGSNVIRVAKTKGYDIVALARRPEALRVRFPDIQIVPGLNPSRIGRADSAEYLVSIIGEPTTYRQWTEVSW